MTLRLIESTRAVVFRVVAVRIAGCAMVAGEGTDTILCHRAGPGTEMPRAWTTRMASLLLWKSGDEAPESPQLKPEIAVRFLADSLATDVLISLRTKRFLIVSSGSPEARGTFGKAYRDFLKMFAEALPNDREIDELIELEELQFAESRGSRSPPSPPPNEDLPSVGEFVMYDEAPLPVQQVRPTYPQFAKDAQIEGTVLLHVLVAADGRVRHIRVVRGITGLDQAAVDAVKRWEFRPATREGRPVAVWVEIPMDFHLD
jgi:protein TonB